MKNAIKTILIGGVGGACAGLIGIGGGIIMIPGMVLLLDLNQHTAHATSLAAIAPLAVISSVIYSNYGNLNFSLAILFAIGGILGAYIGSSMMPYVKPTILKRILAIACILTAIKMGV